MAAQDTHQASNTGKGKGKKRPGTHHASGKKGDMKAHGHASSVDREVGSRSDRHQLANSEWVTSVDL